MLSTSWHRISRTIFAVVLGALILPAQAQYPSKPIQLIVSSTPGAGTDLMARTLSDRLARRLGASVIVDNRGGAGGLIAARVAKKAAPDGYTLMFTNDNLVLLIALGSNREVNVLTDFEHVLLTSTTDFLLVVSGDALAAKTPLVL